MGLGARAAGLGKPPGELGVPEKAPDGGGDGFRRLRRDEEPVRAVLDDVGNAADIGPDDGEPGGHRFDEGIAHALRTRWAAEQVGGGEELRQDVMSGLAGEDGALSERKLAGEGFETRAFLPLPGDEELHLFRQEGERAKKKVDAVLADEARGGDDDRVAAAEAARGANGAALLFGEPETETRQVDAVRNDLGRPVESLRAAPDEEKAADGLERVGAAEDVPERPADEARLSRDGLRRVAFLEREEHRNIGEAALESRGGEGGIAGHDDPDSVIRTLAMQSDRLPISGPGKQPFVESRAGAEAMDIDRAELLARRESAAKASGKKIEGETIHARRELADGDLGAAGQRKIGRRKDEDAAHVY